MRTSVCPWTTCLFWSFAALLTLSTALPLAAQQPKLLRTLGEKDNGLYRSLAFSPDGKTLASSWMWKIKLYDSMSDKVLADFDADPQKVQHAILTYRPDGKVLASVDRSVNAKIKLWDTATHEKIREIDSGFSFCLAFSPDGKVLATSGQYAEVQLWDPETGKKLATLEGRKRPATMLAFSPDGKTLASACVKPAVAIRQDGDITLWDVANRKETGTIAAKIKPYCLAFNPDGMILACGGHEGENYVDKIVLWDLAAGEETTLFKDPRGRPGSGINSMVYTPDGKTLVTAAGRQIALRDATTGKATFLLEGPGLNSSEARALTIALSPDGGTLAAGGTSLRLWSLPTTKKK